MKLFVRLGVLTVLYKRNVICPSRNGVAQRGFFSGAYLILVFTINPWV